MKCNHNKISNFFKSDKFDQETKNFVMSLFNSLIKEDYINELNAQVLFLDLGFYEVEEKDNINYIEVIDFYQLSQFEGGFRKILFKVLKSKVLGDNTNQFGDMLIEDLKLYLPYSEWNKVTRKRKKKLEILNNVEQ